MKKIFYIIKPLIPRRLQLFLRRILAKRKVLTYSSVWPIYPSSEVAPEGWRGWPESKKFALVLTHDVEKRGGHDKSRKLLEIEKELGFKSSFNFVPERYKVDMELLNYINSEGFEVGVHGLNHDGNLFRNKQIFMQRARKINQYMKEWDCVGFRAPAMHHNLEWIKELEIEYDLSTFDTDPFEPQPDGVGTIFPFWIDGNNNNSGYLEMPYTLVQDFTLFILMEETTPKIWMDKLDWIAKEGGMALVNVHPDYMNFNNERRLEEFPADYYSDFLKLVKDKYAGKYWNALPKEVAEYCR